MGARGELIQVVVELDAMGDPIRGSVRSEAGVRAFDGWMELTAALEDVRLAARDGLAANPVVEDHAETDHE